MNAVGETPFSCRELIVASTLDEPLRTGSHRARKQPTKGAIQWLWQLHMRRYLHLTIVRSCARRSSHQPSAPQSSGTTFSFMALLPGLFLVSSIFPTKMR